MHDPGLSLKHGGLIVCREVLDGLHFNGPQVLADVVRGLDPCGKVTGGLFFLLDA